MQVLRWGNPTNKLTGAATDQRTLGSETRFRAKHSRASVGAVASSDVQLTAIAVAVVVGKLRD